MFVTTHPLCDHTPSPCRVNLGGMQTAGYLQRLLQLKYPDLQVHITLSCAQEILHHHSYLALDYGEELRAWATPPSDRQLEYRRIQLPFNQVRLKCTGLMHICPRNKCTDMYTHSLRLFPW